MDLKHIEIGKLTLSHANMRAKGKAPDIANILPSVRARGVIVLLIVRANGSPETYEIVAGKRRYHAALAVASEGGEIASLPCVVMAAGDDAAALETSLIENVARLDPDEVTRWESFTRLIREGRTPEDIALTFGLTELQVKSTLALGSLLPRIRTLYRRGDIDAPTVRHLTLASKSRQRDWLALLDDETAYCPSGHALKAWLFGGASIPVSAAMFDLAGYDGDIISDLFGEERYFADAAVFWTAQTVAIEAKAQSYRDAGWSEVIILPTGEAFYGWEYEHTPKRKGGKVYLAVSARGDVSVHEGYLTLKDARRRAGEDSVARPARPEISTALQSYVDLHRHAAVRNAVADNTSVALRLVVAHMIAGSGLWSVRVEPQRTANAAVAESVETCASEAAFDERRRAMLAMLGFDPETPTITGGYDGDYGVARVFAKLLALPDAAVRDVLALVMAETLDAGSALIEMLGTMLGVDMASVWQADHGLLDLIRDREVLGAVPTEVAGADVATANEAATGKVKRQIIGDCLTGSNGRAKVDHWVPRWMAFPPGSYTERGGVGTVNRAAQIADVAPEPSERALRVAA